MNEEVAGLLGLSAEWQKVQVHVLSDSVETFKSMALQIDIESADRQFSKTINVQTCPREVTGNYQIVNWNQYQNNWPHLAQCHFLTPAKDGFADLLTGVDNPNLHFSMIDFQGPQGGPVACLGPLGWTCIGPPAKCAEYMLRSHCTRILFTKGTTMNANLMECCNLDCTLRNFWEIENVGTEAAYPNILTQEEILALQKVKESLSVVDGRYQVGVPWKEEKSELPNNRSMAISRLCCTEKNLTKKSIVAKEYQRTIEAYLQKGYLRKIDPVTEKSPGAWYLPHFPIVRMDKSTTKVRIVFDCSAQHNRVSLNDVIHPGPKLQKDLFDVLV